MKTRGRAMRSVDQRMPEESSAGHCMFCHSMSECERGGVYAGNLSSGLTQNELSRLREFDCSREPWVLWPAKGAQRRVCRTRGGIDLSQSPYCSGRRRAGRRGGQPATGAWVTVDRRMVDGSMKTRRWRGRRVSRHASREQLVPSPPSAIHAWRVTLL